RSSTLFPYTTLFRSGGAQHGGHEPLELGRVSRRGGGERQRRRVQLVSRRCERSVHGGRLGEDRREGVVFELGDLRGGVRAGVGRSEEHTSELQSRSD